MVFYNAKPMNFPINDGTEERNAYATDVEVLCPECGCWSTFGVAISKEHFERTIKNIEKEYSISEVSGKTSGFPPNKLL